MVTIKGNKGTAVIVGPQIDSQNVREIIDLRLCFSSFINKKWHTYSAMFYSVENVKKWVNICFCPFSVIFLSCRNILKPNKHAAKSIITK